MTVRTLIALAALLAPTAQAGVRFQEGGLDAAIAAAGKAKKIVMVDVYATWCGPCHELDRTVFAKDEVAKALAPRIVAVKIDGEKEPEGPPLMERYHVVGFPTVLFIGPDGNEIDRIFDVPEPKEFVKTALGYVEGKGTLADREQEFSRSATPDLAYEIGFRHAVKGHEGEAKSYYMALATMAERYEEMQAIRHCGRSAVPPDLSYSIQGDARSGEGKEVAVSRFRAEIAAQAQKLLPDAFFDLGKYLYLRGVKDYVAAEKALKLVIEKFPGTKQAEAAEFQLAYAYHGQKDLAKTKAALDGYLAKQGNKGANAYAWFCFKKEVFQAEGIRVAEEALKADPKDAGLWDTLAELYGATGRARDAVAAADKAIANDKKEPYYKEQRKKFLAMVGSAKAK